MRCSPLVGGLLVCATALSTTACTKPPTDNPGATLGQGTLGVSPDGTRAASVYSSVGRVEIFDVKDDKLLNAVDLPGVTRLGRVTLSDDSAYVVEQQAGTVIKIDLQSGDTKTSAFACHEPRGTTLSPDGATLHVACADGLLVSLATADLHKTRTVELEPDLRDVQNFEDGLVVTRFRKAEVLVVDEEGAVVESWQPPYHETLGEPGVAWRMVSEGDKVYVLYQYMSETPLGGGPGGYYGNGCSFQVVRPMLAVLKRDAEGEFTQDAEVSLNGAAGALDLAVRDGAIAVAIPGNAWAPRERPSLLLMNDGVQSGSYVDTSSCNGTSVFGGQEMPPTEREAPVAVAMSLKGRVITQSSEGGLRADIAQVAIEGDGSATYAEGERMFHMSTDLGIACASCHPDGGDDGHTWSFASAGLRRSQNLRGGLSERKVFHWSGDLPNVKALMEEVFVGRMGLNSPPSELQRDGMVKYLDSLPGEAVASNLATDAVERGKDLFTSAGCSDCHAGPRYTDGKVYDVGTGGEFVTPSLLGVHVRAPYLHDGCASDLYERFGACGGGDQHGATSQLKERQIDDLVVFLRSL